MKLVHEIGQTFKKFTRKREDRKLVREMRRQLPDMMAEIDRMAADIRKADLSIHDVMRQAARYYTVPVAPELPVKPQEIVPPPIDPLDCIVLQNPITVARQPFRIRSAA